MYIYIYIYIICIYVYNVFVVDLFLCTATLVHSLIFFKGCVNVTFERNWLILLTTKSMVLVIYIKVITKILKFGQEVTNC